MHKFYMMLGVLLFNVGCGATYPVINAEDPHATIQFDLAGVDYINFYSNGKDCSNKVKFTEKSNPLADDALPLKVTANEEIAFGVIDERMLGYEPIACEILVSFTPQDAQNYLFRYTGDGVNCNVKMYLINSKGKNVPYTGMARRVWLESILGTGSNCDETRIGIGHQLMRVCKRRAALNY